MKRVPSAWLRPLRGGDSEIPLALLASRARVPKGTLSKYENDDLAVPVSTVVKLARIAGRDPEVVVIDCLARCFPDLATTSFGEKLQAFASHRG